MKLSANILALFFAAQAGAFAPSAGVQKTTALKSSNTPAPFFGAPEGPPGAKGPAPGPGPVAPETKTKSSSISLGKMETVGGGMTAARGGGVWDIDEETWVQGDSLRTWSFVKPKSESQQVVLRTDGRPVNANVDLWIGPDWTPYQMKVYSEDGLLRPVRTSIGTKGATNTLAVRNTAHMEFPLASSVAESVGEADLKVAEKRIMDKLKPRKVEGGGAVYTVPFAPEVERVQVLLNTQGMKLHARIELLQGPNNIKQAFELHTNDGLNRPFFAVLEAPGSGNVVRIVNLSTLEFPLNAYAMEA